MLKFGTKQLFCGILLIILLNLPVTHGDVYQHSNVTDIFDPMESIEHPFDLLVTTLATATTSGAEKAFVSNIYYISPDGSNANSGKELSKPWKTFGFAIPSLHPGDTLIMLDGIYQKDTTGLPYINCSDTKYANHGTKTAPITIRAQNERQAFLKSDGSESALYMKNCSHWNIIGLRGGSADLPEELGGRLKSVFTINRSNDVILKRLLSTHSNRYFNAHTYEIAYSSEILIEESESYYFHRHGFDIYKCKNVTIRRSYANSRSYSDLSGGYDSINPDGGDESFVFYYSSDSIIENSISHGNNLGFEIHGGPNFDNSAGGHDNRILGSIYLNGEQYGARIDTRDVNGSIWPTENNLYKNFLVIASGRSGIILSSTSGAQIENATIFQVGGDGIQAKETVASDPWCDDLQAGCSFRVSNSLIYDGSNYGIRVRNATNWLVEYSNLINNPDGNFNLSELNLTEDISDGVGHIRYSTSITPSSLGLNGGNTMVYIPSNSNMKGKGKAGSDIGANILFRYKDGVLTGNPLWDPATGMFPCGAIVPFMNDIKGSSCIDVHKVLNVDSETLPPDFGVILYDNYSYLPFILESTH